jgi:uncharacterized protein (DUF305 family)
MRPEWSWIAWNGNPARLKGRESSPSAGCSWVEKSVQMICSALSHLRVFLGGPQGMVFDEFKVSCDIDCRRGPCPQLKAAGAFGPIAVVLVVALANSSFASSVRAQQSGAEAPAVVQPGAPGKPTKALPPGTKATLPPRSKADVEFMQGMIMHHAQAVEMTALIASHTENKELRALGARISSSQSDEIKFMKRWLATRGEPLSMEMAGMSGMSMSGGTMPLMPGMLSAEQMEALRNAKGAEFDRLFLTGMIQHHDGALTMVKDLFDTAGAGQDAEIFNFATDADNTQRAEIKIMQSMLEKKTPEENR